MTRLLQPVFLLLLLAPVLVRALPRDQYFGDGRTLLVVSDKQTEEPLIGATVTVISGADTLRGATAKSASYFGIQAMWECDRVFRDSVSLEVSFLGYKPFTQRYAGGEFSRYIRVRLDVDEQSIAQVVVTGRSIAMIFRGDTTVYNAAAFKTMADDRLSELLKQLPGIEVKDNKIYADGEEVKRVYVDGRNLFGRQTAASLTDLEAADVKNVRVYEEQNPEARRTGDDTAAKEKVMDVETKSKRGVLWGGELQAMAGASLEKDYSGRHEVRHAEQMRLYRHSEKGSTSLNAANTKDESQRESASLSSKITPTKRTRAELSHEYRRGDSTSVWVLAHFNRNRRSSTGSTYTDYFPTADYDLRRDETHRENSSKDLSARISNMIGIQRRKNSFHADWGVNYAEGSTSGRNSTDRQFNDEKTYTRIGSEGSNRSVSANASLYYTIRLAERSRLNMQTVVNYYDRKNDDWQVDTVASVPALRMELRNRGNTEGYDLSATVEYYYKTGEKSSLTAGYHFSRRYDRSERRSLDFLNDPRGVTDTVNTYDYTVDYYTNRLTLSWTYNTETIRCYANLWGSMYDLTRDERFPDKERSPRRFFSLSPTFTLMAGKSRNRLHIFAGVSPQMPSAEQLRSTLDATNPMLLRAGNPDLKLPATLSGTLRYYNNDAATARSISLGFSWGYDFNFVTTRQRFFLEETYLPQYDYTAQKGAQLASEVNVSGSYNLGGGFSYSQQIAPIRSTVRLDLNYRFAQTPYFYNETLDRSGSHSLHLSVGFESGFSAKVKFAFGATTSLSSYRTQEQLRQDLRETVQGRLNLRFGPYFGSIGTLYQFYCNSASKSLTRHDVMLTASAGRKFGKENRLSLSVGAVDVLNRPDFVSTKFETNYVRTTSTSYLGRYAYLQAAYTF